MNVFVASNLQRCVWQSFLNIYNHALMLTRLHKTIKHERKQFAFHKRAKPVLYAGTIIFLLKEKGTAVDTLLKRWSMSAESFQTVYIEIRYPYITADLLPFSAFLARQKCGSRINSNGMISNYGLGGSSPRNWTYCLSYNLISEFQPQACFLCWLRRRLVKRCILNRAEKTAIASLTGTGC